MEEQVDKTIYNSFEQELIDSGYKIFKSEFSRAIRGFQKRFDNEIGKKFFITIWHWNHHKQLCRYDIPNIDSYEFTSQFRLDKRNKDLTVDINVGAKVLSDEYGEATSKLIDIEDFFDKMWYNMGDPYYETWEEC